MDATGATASAGNTDVPPEGTRADSDGKTGMRRMSVSCGREAMTSVSASSAARALTGRFEGLLAVKSAMRESTVAGIQSAWSDRRGIVSLTCLNATFIAVSPRKGNWPAMSS